ncbi:MAG: NAD(P)H-hydrate dehydratase [Rhizobiales bacterium]|nr:NAD(P)H-hydrate dehydratase [Hyphomicrobiales bacterium]
MELYNISDMQKADQLAIKSGINGKYLMEQAGSRVASHIERICSGPSHLCIIAGPGNNGGDAFVVARLLLERAYKIDMFHFCTKHEQIEGVDSDADFMKKKWENVGGITQPFEMSADLKSSLETSKLIIDGLFGAGLNRKIEEPIASIFQEINQAAPPILAIDVPSGLNGNTGQIMGTVIKADYTSSFYRPKQGHYLYPGRDFCGELKIDNIGIPERVNKELSVKQHINSPSLWREKLQNKSPNAHKYHHGSVMVISGDKTMRGAAVLSSNAAIKSGTGLVTIAENRETLEVHPQSFAAVMLSQAPESDSEADWKVILEQKKTTASLIGPGSLPDKKTQNRVLSLIEYGERLVLDAGAITAFEGQTETLSTALNNHSNTNDPIAVLTPHEGEFKKLFPDLDVKDKIQAARKAAERLKAIMVLKGPDTVIAAPDGRVLVNINAPATLATAGSGDVLAGIIVALAANKAYPLFEAAAAGVYIHSECANKIGTELIADDIVVKIAEVKNEIWL